MSLHKTKASHPNILNLKKHVIYIHRRIKYNSTFSQPKMKHICILRCVVLTIRCHELDRNLGKFCEIAVIWKPNRSSQTEPKGKNAPSQMHTVLGVQNLITVSAHSLYLVFILEREKFSTFVRKNVNSNLKIIAREAFEATHYPLIEDFFEANWGQPSYDEGRHVTRRSRVLSVSRSKQVEKLKLRTPLSPLLAKHPQHRLCSYRKKWCKQNTHTTSMKEKKQPIKKYDAVIYQNVLRQKWKPNSCASRLSKGQQDLGRPTDRICDRTVMDDTYRRL